MYKLITICFGTGCAQAQCWTSHHCPQTVLKLYTLYLITVTVYTVVLLYYTVILSYHNYTDPYHAMNNPIIILTMLQYRNLTVSPCGRSAGTVPEPPELDTQDKIILRND